MVVNSLSELVSNVPTKLHPSVSAEDIRKQKAREGRAKPAVSTFIGNAVPAHIPRPSSPPRADGQTLAFGKAAAQHVVAEPTEPRARKTTAGMKVTRTARVISSRVEVDSDIPPPGDAYGAQAYPFGTMAVGDSFFVERTKKGFTSVANANKTHAPKVFTSRFMKGDDPKHPGKVGCRVWRIK